MMNKETKIINCNLNENDDSFSWKELSCVFKPWAIVLKSISDSYFDSFLCISSFVQVYLKSKNENFYLMMDIYDEFIEKFLNVKIIKNKFTSKEDLVTKIVDILKEEKPVLVNTDLYGLCYYPNYQAEHYSHLLIIKGIDVEKEVVYILDNIHVNGGTSTIYKDFTLKIRDLYEMIEIYNENFEVDQNIFYTLEANNIRKISNIETFQYINHIISMNSGRIVNWERKIFESNGAEEKIVSYYQILNFRNVFQFYFEELFNNYNEKKYIIEYETINKEWKEILNQVYYCRLKKKKRDYIEKDCELGNRIIENEKRFIAFLKDLSSKIDEYISTTKEQNSDYNIKNKKKAVYNICENSISVCHSKENVYDTWLTSNDAFQLLFDGRHINCFETKVHTDTGRFNYYHAGIIIYTQDYSKYLLGLHRGNDFSVFCPMRDDFCLLTKDIDDSQSLKIKLKIESQNLYVQINDDNEVNEIILDSPISKIGIFSKTWLQFEHKMTFDYIRINDAVKEL